MLQSMVDELSGHPGEALTLVPSAMCPGHYDLRPSDIRRVAQSDAVLLHGFQASMSKMQGLIAAASLPSERLHVIEVKGNWMAPPVQSQALLCVGRVMAELDKADAAKILSRSKVRSRDVLALGQETEAHLALEEVGEVGVLCSSMQAPFVQWLGFKILDTFGRSEALSVARINALLEVGKASHAALVIDNLQSGDTRISAVLARDCGAQHVVLSNFPGAYKNTETWEKAFRFNLGLILDALAQWRNLHE